MSNDDWTGAYQTWLADPQRKVEAAARVQHRDYVASLLQPLIEVAVEEEENEEGQTIVNNVAPELWWQGEGWDITLETITDEDGMPEVSVTVRLEASARAMRDDLIMPACKVIGWCRVRGIACEVVELDDVDEEVEG